ncbi:hypothetical protein BJP39_24325 [Streptomyces sp. CC77]|nr:hypothetical protein BJP39_24325 [Streptomyces sp. CC77]
MTDGIQRRSDMASGPPILRGTPAARRPRSGTFARDGDGRFGVFLGVVGRFAVLRPVGGARSGRPIPARW